MKILLALLLSMVATSQMAPAQEPIAPEHPTPKKASAKISPQLVGETQLQSGEANADVPMPTTHSRLQHPVPQSALTVPQSTFPVPQSTQSTIPVPQSALAVPQSALPAPVNQQPDQAAMMEEIAEIRRQLGGGIGAQLRDLNLQNPLKPLKDREAAGPEDLESTWDRHFKNEIRRRLAQEHNDRQSIAVLPTDRQWLPSADTRFPPDDPRSVDISQSSRAMSPGHSIQLHRNSQSPKKSQLLRNSARRLDEIAADLEEVGLYQEADAIRQQARNFWLQARRSSD